MIMSRLAATPGVSQLPRSRVGRRLAAVRASLRGFQLDLALAEGDDPWSTAELMSRASRLSSLSERRRLAAGIAALVSRSEDRSRVTPYVVAVPIVAQIAVLLSDPWSPVYQGGKDPRGPAEVTSRCLLGAG